MQSVVRQLCCEASCAASRAASCAISSAARTFHSRKHICEKQLCTKHDRVCSVTDATICAASVSRMLRAFPSKKFDFFRKISFRKISLWYSSSAFAAHQLQLLPLGSQVCSTLRGLIQHRTNYLLPRSFTYFRLPPYTALSVKALRSCAIFCAAGYAGVFPSTKSRDELSSPSGCQLYSPSSSNF